MAEFKNVIRKCRKNSHLTQEQAAEQLGLKVRIWKYYESGERMPSRETLEKMASLFSVSIDYLLGNTDELMSETHELEMYPRFGGRVSSPPQPVIFESLSEATVKLRERIRIEFHRESAQDRLLLCLAGIERV